MSETSEMTEGIRTEWPALPSRSQLEIYFALRPGCEYLWCLWNNQPHAEQVEGWAQVSLNAPNGSVPMPRFKIAGHNVVLLARGKPIPGASHNSTGIPMFIDPELEKLLGLAPEPLPKLPPAPDGKPVGKPQGPQQKPAQTAAA